MARHDLLPRRRIIGEKVENQPVGRVFGARDEWQAPAQQGVKEPMLGDFDFAPRREAYGISEIGHGTVVTASAAVSPFGRFINQPVAAVELFVGTEQPRFAQPRYRLPALACGFDGEQRQAIRIEGEAVAALSAGAVLEVKNVLTSRTNE